MDYKKEYKELQMRLIEMRIRCSGYRKSTELALEWLKRHEKDNIHPSTNITHLSEKSLWAKIEERKAHSQTS